MDLRIWRGSTQYVYVPVTSATSPTSKPVTVAVVLHGTEPVSGDFKPAAWEPGTTKARVLVGPNSDIGDLAPGFYRIWVKVDDDPEDPGFAAPNYLVIYDTA